MFFVIGENGITAWRWARMGVGELCRSKDCMLGEVVVRLHT